VVLRWPRFEHGAVSDSDSDPPVTLRSNLRSYRIRSGLTQEALAHAADLHPNAVGMVERGERDPRLSTLIAIARAISALTDEQVTAADLVRGVR
jgi:DNA-binding XRE family transcriptional regulator